MGHLSEPLQGIGMDAIQITIDKRNASAAALASFDHSPECRDLVSFLVNRGRKHGLHLVVMESVAEDRANACDYLRANIADESDHTATPLTQSLAEQVIDRIAEAIGISNDELAGKLASHWAKSPGV